VKNLRIHVRRGEEETNRVYKKWENNDYRNMKVMRRVEDRWITYI
jgi:hypothetical protein